MDNEAGPHPTSFMTYHDLSRHGIYTYALYFYLSSAFTFASCRFLSYTLRFVLLVLSRQSLSLAYS